MSSDGSYETSATARLSLRHLSELAGVSNPYLSQIERGLRKPSAEILQQIAKALRISAETLYVRAGILEERDAAKTDPIPSILMDPTLSPAQRQAIVSLYQSFRRENGAGEPQAAKRGATRRGASESVPSGSRSVVRGKGAGPGSGPDAPPDTGPDADEPGPARSR